MQSELIKGLRRIGRDVLLNRLLASSLLPDELRRIALRLCGMHIARGVRVSPWCFFGGADISMGEETFVNYRCFFDNAARIELGAKCHLGMEVMLCTGTHRIGDRSERATGIVAAPIVVEDACWIGTRSVILPGVRVGAGCIVAAGAVVAEDCEPHGVYAGVPAKRVREVSAG